jgi:acyl-CoA thioester hydrolase
MESFVINIQIRWSDLDPNIHLRHSVYYDWGAICRIEFLGKHGLGTDRMKELQIGPILFREECVFKREIQLGDIVTIDLELLAARRDYSRWTFRHTVVKNNETVAAILTLDGAWLDIAKRKLAIPPGEINATFSQMPLAKDFKWLD